MPLSGPPPTKLYALRCLWNAAAYMMFGSVGSMMTSVTPVCGLIVRTAFQVFPPFTVLYSPRSPPSAQRGPTAATYTMFGFVGLITIRPTCCDVLRPMFVQVLPPFSDL